MKTLERVDWARAMIAERIRTPGLSDDQTILLVGMLNALVWVADGRDSKTMQRILDGEPFAVGEHWKGGVFNSIIRGNG